MASKAQRELSAQRAAATHQFDPLKHVSTSLGVSTRERPLSPGILVTAFVALLQRYSGESSFTFQTRFVFDTPETHATPGQEYSLRISFSGDLTLETLRSRVYEIVAESGLYLTDSGEWPKTLSRLLLTTPHQLQSQLARCGIAPLLDYDDSLLLTLSRADCGLVGTIEYMPAIIDDRTAVRFAEHFQNVLHQVVEHQTAYISGIPLLSDREQHEILVAWNSTGRLYQDGCVHDIFERQAERTPEAVALAHRENALTFRELNMRSNRLAHFLRRQGVRAEVFVGLCMDQSPEAVVAVVGILKAGGAYVPLDPALPRERMAEMVQDSGVLLVITTSALRHGMPSGVRILCLEDYSLELTTENAFAPTSDTIPDNSAYVLYTSGSTGKPKGVIGIHRSILNGLMSVSYAPDERCCLNAFLSFGFSIANLFLPLLSGLRLVILSAGELRDINQMLNIIDQERISRIALIPQVFQQMLDSDQGTISRLRCIRAVGLAGAALYPTLIERFTEAMPHAELHNCYSSSEIGTLATIWDVSKTSRPRGEVILGHPVANTRIYILDKHMNAVPIGLVGELYVGAAHLARGYLKRPGMTAERFVPDPFNTAFGTRLYRTGDLGRFLVNGEIEFLGRADDQVKIRGFRIELTEIDQALASHDAVRDAVVSTVKVESELQLVAYIVVNRKPAPSVSELRRHLREHLPDYMMPSAFVFLDSLPLSPNGKVDRSALPSPDPSRPNLDTQYVEPRNPVEVALIEIWGEQLRVRRIGVHDHFLDLGGDSLIAVKIALEIHARFGIEVHPALLLEYPTVERISAALLS